MISALHKAIDAENIGDLTTWASYWTDDVTVTMDGRTIAKSRDELIAVVTAGRSRGWTGQFVTDASARGNLVTYHYYDTFVDGAIVHAAAVIAFDENDKVTTLHVLTSLFRRPSDREQKPI